MRYQQSLFQTCEHSFNTPTDSRLFVARTLHSTRWPFTDDCSTKRDGFLHNAASYNLLASTKVKIVPNKLIGQDVFKLRRAFIHLQQVVSARIFNAANVFVSAVSS
jgi:hypothetical protein